LPWTPQNRARTDPISYLFLPCRTGYHRDCKGSYLGLGNMVLGELPPAQCNCDCHTLRGAERRALYANENRKPQTQNGNARKVRG
jgi:hypothetical protein